MWSLKKIVLIPMKRFITGFYACLKFCLCVKTLIFLVLQCTEERGYKALKGGYDADDRMDTMELSLW